MLWGSGTLDPWRQPHQSLYANTWINTAWLPCWGRCCTRGKPEESVAHRKWGMQARKYILPLKPMADVSGYQWPHKIDWCSTIVFKKVIKPDLRDLLWCHTNMKWCSTAQWSVSCCDYSSPVSVRICFQPHANGPTWCTTGIWSSYTHISVNAKINPLLLCGICS